MTIPLKTDIVYGPVNSRRLGHSLGINLLPFETKLCSFNCVYCQYGWTQKEKQRDLQLKLPSTEEVCNEVEAAIKKLATNPDFITLSGNGEATSIIRAQRSGDVP